MQFTKKSLQQTTLLLLLGLTIREVFSFWTGHPYDFELWVRLGYAMIHGGNPYGFLGPAPGLSFANLYSLRDSATIAYLPFWPLITGVLYMLYLTIGLNDRFLYYLFLKQPTILGDVALGYLLYSYVRLRNLNSSVWVLRFWMLCPFTIILSGIWGMFDSLAMAFVMISIMTTRHLKRAFWAGLGTFAKSIPVIYTIPLSLKSRRNWQSFLVAIALPIGFSAATFAVMGWSLTTVTSALSYTVTRSGESMSVWDLFFYFNYQGIIPTLDPFVSDLLGILWIPAVIIFTLIAYRKFGFDSDYGLIQSLLVVTLSFLVFKSRVTEQYAIYLLALSTVDFALWNPNRKPLFLATAGVALLYLVMNNFLLIRFLSPVYLDYGQIENGLSQVIGPARLAVNFLSGSVFTALNAGYLISILRSKSPGAISAS